MNLDNVETFLYVVHFKSIQQTADALFLTQPAISARIKALEKDLATTLFLREGKYLTLTEAGHQFLPFAHQISQAMHTSRAQLRDVAQTTALAIGTTPLISEYIMPKLLPKLTAHQIKHVTLPTEDLLTEVIQHKVDVALMTAVNQQGIKQEKVMSNPIQLIAPLNHPLIKQQNVTLQQLAKESFVLFESGESSHPIFAAVEATPHIALTTHYVTVAKSFIKQGLGIGFLPLLCITKEIIAGDFAVIPTNHLTKMQQDIYLTYRDEAKVTVIREVMESIFT